MPGNSLLERKHLPASKEGAPDSASGRTAGPVSLPLSSGVRRVISEPVRRARLLETGDVDAARGVFVELYAAATLEPDAGASFGCVLDITVHGLLQIVEGHWTAGWSASTVGHADRYILSFCGNGHLLGQRSGKKIATVPGCSGILLSPGDSVDVRVAPGFLGQTLTLPVAMIDAHFRALTGRDVAGGIRFEPMLDLEGAGDFAIHEIVKLYRREVQRIGSSPIWLVTLRDALLTSLLLNARSSASGIMNAPAPRVAPGSVRRAEEFIAAHAGEALTLADIVAAVGVPARSLRASFAATRGYGPMEHLRRCRFELARRTLSEASPGTTVTGVVVRLGLGAAGRFSVEYKKRFGESPSETLAAGRARAGLEDRPSGAYLIDVSTLPPRERKAS